jgi:hypothetical protein
MKYIEDTKNDIKNDIKNDKINRLSKEQKDNNYSLLIKKLPIEIFNIIKDYLPINVILFCSKKIYIENHELVKKYICKDNYERYVRNIIERDYWFILGHLIKENYDKWMNKKKYFYKNMSYYNYYYFLIDYSVMNSSIICTNTLSKYIINSGLSKNQHKKNTCKNIIWIN